MGDIRNLIMEGHIRGWGLCDALSKPVRLACLHHGEALDDKLI
jgi:hypothetical protein